MISFPKPVRAGLMMIAALGIIGGLIFSYDFSEINAGSRSSGSFGKKDTETKNARVKTGDPNHERRKEAVAGEVIPDELTPAQAALLFEQFKSKYPGNQQRSDFAYEMIKKLCELGYTQEAWNLIEKDHGNVRINQLAAYFANAELTRVELLTKISESSRSDIHVSFKGFMSRFKPEQFEEILSSSDFQQFLGAINRLDPKDAKVFRSSISSGLDHAITIPIYESPEKANDLLKIAVRLNSQGLLDTTRFVDLAVRFGRSDPFGNWKLIYTIEPEGVNSKALSEDRSTMIRDMLEADAPKALSKVLDNENPGKASDINSAIGAWVNLDAKGATDWFQQNRATLSPQDSDSIAAAFSTHAADLSEFSGAQQWAGQIRDPKLKAEVIKKIAEVTAAKENRASEPR